MRCFPSAGLRGGRDGEERDAVRRGRAAEDVLMAAGEREGEDGGEGDDGRGGRLTDREMAEGERRVGEGRAGTDIVERCELCDTIVG